MVSDARPFFVVHTHLLGAYGTCESSSEPIIAVFGHAQEVIQSNWNPDWEGAKGGGGGPNPLHKGLKVDNPFRSPKL